MQEERTKRQEKEEPEEGGTVGGVDDPSLEEDQAAAEETEQTDEGEEEEPVEEETTEVEKKVEVPVQREPIQRRGCLKGCLIPVAAIFAIIMVILAIGYSKRDAISNSLLKRIIANTQNNILGDLPEGMDEKQIEAAFEEVKLALSEGRIDREALMEAMEKYHDAIGDRPPSEQKKQYINELVTDLNAAIVRRDR